MTETIRQGSLDFSIKHKVQTTWGFQEAMTFSLEGLGAAFFVLSLIEDRIPGMIIGLVLLVIAGGVLFMHLGNPKNIFYVMANFRHSWMSRGAAAIPAFIGLGAILVITRVTTGQTAGFLIIGAFALLGMFVLVKSGLVLSSFPAIPFWSGGLLPVLFALNGVASALALFALIGPVNVWALPATLVALLVTTMIYLLSVKEAGRAAKVSVALIGERHFVLFYGVAIGLGIVLALAISVLIAINQGAATLPLVMLLAVLRLAGDVAMRDVILKVGVYDKIL